MIFHVRGKVRAGKKKRRDIARQLAAPAEHEGEKLPDEMEKKEGKDTEKVIENSEEEKGFDVV